MVEKVTPKPATGAKSWDRKPGSGRPDSSSVRGAGAGAGCRRLGAGEDPSGVSPTWGSVWSATALLRFVGGGGTADGHRLGRLDGGARLDELLSGQRRHGIAAGE